MRCFKAPGRRGFVPLLAGLLVLCSAPHNSIADESIEAWAAERDTNFDTLAENWRLTQPVTLTIRFALREGPVSPSSERFLEALKRDVGSLEFGTNFEVRPVVVPAKYHYAMSIDFATLSAWRQHETSPALLDFVGTYWRDHVTAADETLAITPPR